MSHVMEALTLTVTEDLTYETYRTGYTIINVRNVSNRLHHYFLSGVTGYLEFLSAFVYI